MKWKYWRLLSVLTSLVLAVYCLVISTTIEVKAYDYTESSIVTFGLYDYETRQVVQSQPDYFFDHYWYGLTHSIYNYEKVTYGDNGNFPSDVSILADRIKTYFGQDFFDLLSTYHWLMNIYAMPNFNGQFMLCFNRVPQTFRGPEININQSYLDDTYTVEMLPDIFGSSFYILNSDNIMMSYCPYLNKSGLSSLSGSNLKAGNPTSFTSLSDIKDALSNNNIRSFVIRIFFTLPSLTISGVYPSVYNAYYDANTFKAFPVFIDRNALSWVCIMSDFPIYDCGNYFNIDNGNNHYRVIFNYLHKDSVGFLQNERLSPILISGYDDIPNVTPTPTITPSPLPTWTPYPTPTPFPPVNEIEGISQMMTLFTRKYEFNINGNVIGIRPLYLFVFTFLVGAIFKAIQGGDRN